MHKKFLQATASLAISVAIQLGPCGILPSLGMVQDEFEIERMKAIVKEHYDFMEKPNDATSQRLYKSGHSIISSSFVRNANGELVRNANGELETVYTFYPPMRCTLCNKLKKDMSSKK